MATSERNSSADIAARIADATNVVILSSSVDSGADELCLELLSSDDVDRTNVLLTTFTGTPDTCLREWIQNVGRQPADLKIVSVGETTRSTATVQPHPAGGPTNPAAVETVSSPGDLTGLGIKLSEQLQAWHGDGNRTAIRFDSMTSLVQATDLETTFRFLHVVTGRFASCDATAFFHLDPEAFDTQTVNTLKTLFDAAIERDGDGWTVKGT